MPRTAIQLFTLRGLDESLESKIERVSQTSFDGVEFAGLDGASPNAVAGVLDETGIEAAGAHVRIDQLESDYDEMIEAYGTIGCDRLVVPTYEQAAFESLDGVETAADRLSEMAATLDDDGFELLYHNHTFEFTEFSGETVSGGETAFDRFVDRLDDRVKLEIDTGLARFAGVDPRRLIERYADQVGLVHVTDSRAGSESTVHVELGAGQVDLDGCMRAARDIDVDWLIYEHGRTTDPEASLAHSDTTFTTMLRA